MAVGTVVEAWAKVGVVWVVVRRARAPRVVVLKAPAVEARAMAV